MEIIAVCCGKNGASCRAALRGTATQRVQCEHSQIIQCVQCSISAVPPQRDASIVRYVWTNL